MLAPAIVASIGAVLFSVLALKYFSAPYVWMTACGAAILTVHCIRSQRLAVKRACLAGATSLLLLGALEVYASLQPEPVRKEIRYSSGYFTTDDILGYAPTKATKGTSTLRRDARTIYDVTYTIDDAGLRVTPSVLSSDPHTCAAFFGDSFTFGEGVEDGETMPAVVGELSGYRVYNFAFHGYGPHQMLAAIQRGAVRQVMHCAPPVVVYQALVTHAARSAGYAFWDPHGPKYVLTQRGLEYAGHFNEGLEFRLWNLLNKSYLYQRYAANRHAITPDEVHLFVEIVDAARLALDNMYPAEAFHVILWNENPQDSAYRMERDGLIAKGIRLHLVSDILPGYPANRRQYR